MVKKILVEIQLSDNSLFSVENCISAIEDAVYRVHNRIEDPNFYVHVSEVIDVNEMLAAKGEKYAEI